MIYWYSTYKIGFYLGNMRNNFFNLVAYAFYSLLRLLCIVDSFSKLNNLSSEFDKSLMFAVFELLD